MTIETVGLDHVAIKVRHLPTSVGFYTRVLGCAISDIVTDEFALLYFEAKASMGRHHVLNLVKYSEAERENIQALEAAGDADPMRSGETIGGNGRPTGEPLAYLAFEVSDSDALRHAERELGAMERAVCQTSVFDRDEYGESLSFLDPDGHLILLVCRGPATEGSSAT